MPLPVKIKLIPIPENDPQVIKNPLDCYLTDSAIKKLETLWSSSGDEPIQKNFIAAIADTDDPEFICRNNSSIYANCHRLKSLDLNLREDIAAKVSSNVVDVNVTWTFIEHYSFRHESDRKNLYLVKIDNLVNLESVVVGNVSSAGRQSSDIVKDGSLVRSGDLFLGNKSTVVIECSSVSQGILAASTSITYVTITISQFKSFLSPRRMVSNSLYEHHQSDTIKDKLQVCLLNKIYDEADVLDSENVVVVSQTVARILKLNCAQVSCFRAKMVHVDLKESEWRFVQVVTSNDVKHENVALISPQLWFNFARTIDEKYSSVSDVFALVVSSTNLYVLKEITLIRS